ncbi:hypothetical protein ACMFMF_000874 [Clarireedia jacksonii]
MCSQQETALLLMNLDQTKRAQYPCPVHTVPAYSKKLKSSRPSSPSSSSSPFSLTPHMIFTFPVYTYFPMPSVPNLSSPNPYPPKSPDRGVNGQSPLLPSDQFSPSLTQKTTLGIHSP